MNRKIKNEQEFQEFCTEVRNRQYENNPIMVDISELSEGRSLKFSSTSTYDWNNEYLEILRIDNVDVIKLIRYST